jgi:NAD(P)-dependent dehydrogenase (short-subunit alcohol dehydrogenase family)
MSVSGYGLLDGHVAIVTGASSGIGRGIALRFAEEGARLVVVADLTEKPREEAGPTVEAINAAGSRGEFVATDVSKPTNLLRAVQRAVEFGGRLDVMVNNAGIIGPIDFLNATEAEFDRLMAINVKGVYFGCQAAARAMIPQGGGSIINISSIGGIHGGPRFVAYSSSKGAVRLMTYSLGQLLGPHGIRVNAIHPGVIDTQMNRTDTGSVTPDGMLTGPVPLGRVGTPAEIGSAAVYLASSLASYVNGSSLVVDGGRLAT